MQSCGANDLLNLFRSRDSRRPRLEGGLRLYVIGDVHGRADLIEGVLSKIDADLARRSGENAILVFVGDYVDRGPGSREVLDQLVARVRAHKTILLKGNHEAYLLEFLQNPAILGDWRQYGGLQTLMSYGLKPSLNPGEEEQRELARDLARALPWEHRALLEALPTSFTCGDFFFVHAGVRPGVPLAQQKEQDLLWIREDFLLCEEDFGKVVVHGHTPVAAPDIRPNRINIDTGAYATGRLSCVMLQGEDIEVMPA
jgi:calcineurin-like phosphoesterase family protein